MEVSMRKAFLTALGATAIGFSLPAAAWAQSTPAASAPNASHLPNPRFDAMAKMKKPRIKMSLPADGVKRDDSWFREMRDPCQVEG
jgi:hypothetical protein